MFNRTRKGFTLIELIIVVAVIAILASLAVYNYQRYAFRTRRADGREMLMRVASAQERYFTNFNQYAPNLGALGFVASGPAPQAVGQSEKGYYQVAIAAMGAGNQGYTLRATAQNAQATDQCGNLTLDNTGAKNQSGGPTNGPCW